MPPWFIDIESATEIDAKSKGTPPASRSAAQVWRANSPSSALQGVTRPSVEATPTNGFSRSSSLSPKACRNARCGARSSPSTVMREGSFFIVADDFGDAGAVRQSQFGGAPRAGGLRRAVHDALDLRIGLEAHLAGGAVLDRVPHLLRGGGDAGQQGGSSGTKNVTFYFEYFQKSLHHPAQ